MINATYQLIILGNINGFHDLLLDTLYQRVRELGMESKIIEIIDRDSFTKAYRQNAPALALYYGGHVYLDTDILATLKEDATIILPIHTEEDKFFDEIPEVLHPVNGIKLKSTNDIDAIVNNILEGFSLLRISRRLFVSYRRNESRGTAIQLFEKLEMAGFDVFLDTHSIRKGDKFQEELWHRLVDTDVVVLLNTPKFLSSEWTEKELAKANSMSIGILQLVWPENTPERTAELSHPLFLMKEHFVKGSFKDSKDTLTEEMIEKVVMTVESLRARSLAARQDNIITEFIKFAAMAGRSAILQRERYVTLVGRGGETLVIIPTIGVPHAFSYHQSENLIKLIRSEKVEKIWILYDHINIRENWLEHLAWLDLYLPVSSLKVTDIETWLKKH